MSAVACVVPIRGVWGGKTRLAGALSAEERARLTVRMLAGVVGAALDSGVVGRVAVISPDPVVLALAVGLGPDVEAVTQDAAAPGLNPALDAGRRWAVGRDAAALLVLFGDLPLLSAGDVRNLVRRDAPVVLAPDRHGTGTNALLLRLSRRDRASPDAFRFGFGDGSYARHVDEAHRLGLEVATSLVAGTAFDLDTPEDWRMLRDDWGWADGDLIAEIAGGLVVGPGIVASGSAAKDPS